MQRSPKEVRRLVRRSQIQVAVQAGVSEPTLRLYEANREAVGEEKRRALDAVYVAMEATLGLDASGTVGS